MSEKNHEKLYEAVELDEHGYYKLRGAYRKPMRSFYESEYYQDDHTTYCSKREYDSYVLTHKNYVFAEKERIAINAEVRGRRFLDVGCGEGYALAYFCCNGWDVRGIDLSEYGLMVHNSDMRPFLLKGTCSEQFKALAEQGEKFDFINADNFLEHLPRAEVFFEGVRELCAEEAVVCVMVPNDFSITQKTAYDLGHIDEAFWVTKDTSEHFNYFTLGSLTELGESMGFRKVFATGDWPIDYFLFHPSSNYWKDKQCGHDCYMAKITFENMLFERSPEQTMRLHEAIAEAGIGRAISVYFKLEEWGR